MFTGEYSIGEDVKNFKQGQSVNGASYKVNMAGHVTDHLPNAAHEVSAIGENSLISEVARNLASEHDHVPRNMVDHVPRILEDQSTQPSSGFMLLSVRHLSKVRRDKYRTRSVSPMPRKYGNIPAEENTMDSSRGESSPNSSQSPMVDDESLNEFYGSGSIEAEEFEDDDPDEDAGPIEDRETAVLNHPMKTIMEASQGDVTSNYVIPHVGAIPSGQTAINSRHDRSCPRPPHNAPLGDQSLSNGYCVPHVDSAHHTTHRLVDDGKYPSVQRRSDTDRRMRAVPYLPRVAPHMQQTNTSHCDAQTIPMQNHSVHTAPVSGHTSPPQSSQPSDSHLPTTSRLPVHPNGCDSYQNIRYPHYQHPPHNYAPPTLTCPYHTHPGEVSENSPDHRITASDRGQLVTTGTTVSTVNQPVLQPASRFRKARIHETVEQWSCSRATVHDCRLKAIPDWVSEIHKKSPALEQTLTAAMAKKVNCHSCFTLKSIDVNAFEGVRSGRISNAFKSEQTVDPNNYASCNQKRDKPEKNTTQPLSINFDSRDSNLLTHWEGGHRVNYRTQNLDRVFPSCTLKEMPELDTPGHGTFCSNCCDSFLTRDSGLSHYLPYMKTAECSNAHPKCVLQDGVSEVRTDIVDEGQHSNITRVLDNDLMLPAIALPINSVDPATAYLRRQQAEPTDPRFQLTVQMKSGDSLGGDEFSMAVSDIAQSTPDSTVDHWPQPPTHHSLFVHPPSDTLNSDFRGEAFETHKRNLKTLVPGMVPPTSPNFIDGSITDTGRSDAEPNLTGTEVHPVSTNFPPGTNPESSVNGIHESWLRVHGPSVADNIHARTRLGSGNYHNVTEVDHSEQYSVQSRSFPKRLSSPPSPSVSFQSALTDSQATGTGDSLLINGRALTNGPHRNPYRSPTYLQSGKSGIVYGRVNMTNTSPQQSRPSTKMTVSKMNRDSSRGSRFPGSSSSLLDARVAESMTVLHSALETAFRDQLAVAHAENVTLQTEVQRLSYEVSTLRGYEAAFHNLRTWVPPDIWDHLYHQQQFTSNYVINPGMLPIARPNSPHQTD